MATAVREKRRQVDLPEKENDRVSRTTHHIESMRSGLHHLYPTMCILPDNMIVNDAMIRQGLLLVPAPTQRHIVDPRSDTTVLRSLTGGIVDLQKLIVGRIRTHIIDPWKDMIALSGPTESIVDLQKMIAGPTQKHMVKQWKDMITLGESTESIVNLPRVIAGLTQKRIIDPWKDMTALHDLKESIVDTRKDLNHPLILFVLKVSSLADLDTSDDLLRST